MIDIIREVEDIYNDFGNTLVNIEKPFALSEERTPSLGSCNRSNGIYRVTTPTTSDSHMNMLVKAHEYGHIKCGHLEGVHEEMDEGLRRVIINKDEALINAINESCGIDYADTILDKVIYDPVLNHTIHNIAMDMEVNSTVLSEDDINYMTGSMNQLIYDEYMRLSENGTKQVDMNALNNLYAKFDMKFIHPSTFGFQPGLTYPDYLVQCILNLDKVMNELSNNYNNSNKAQDRLDQQGNQNNQNQQGQGNQGQQGNQNTNDQSNQSQGQPQDGSQSQQSQSGQGGNGGSSQNQSEDPKSNPNMPKTREEFDQMMENMKNSNGGQSGQNQQNQGQSQGQGSSQSQGQQGSQNNQNQQGQGNQGQEQSNESESYSDDHGTESRSEADDKRSNDLGNYANSGGSGIGNDHSSDIRNYQINTDPLEMHLQEIIRECRHKVIKRDFAKDMVHKYNRKILGRESKMLSPTYKQKITKSENPTVVFVIDVSGSMNTSLVDRCVTTIRNQMKRLDRSLKYNIIAWDTELCQYFKDIDFRSPIPKLSCGGGTRMAGAFDLFKKDFSKDAIMILISDFEDYLNQWHEKEKNMNGYSMYGICYGEPYETFPNFKNFKVRKCKSSGRSGW